MTEKKEKTSDPKMTYDVVVIGGGPAGMMAAATAARQGARVLLLEKNKELGKKLSLTGGGRCNVTNNKPVVRTMLTAYADAGKFLFSTFAQHGVAESIAWFAERGVLLKEENEGRLFPVSDSAETIRQVLVDEMKQYGVVVWLGEEVLSVVRDEKANQFVITTERGKVLAKACILATGGYARPDTGSTGDGFQWVTTLGHTVRSYDAALVPLKLATAWTKSLSGLTLPEVKVSVWSDGKKQVAKTGRVLFTHFGVTGPLIINMSRLVGELLPHAAVELKLDLFPRHDAGALKDYFHTLLASNKKMQNALAEVLPLQLVKGLLAELHIDGETPCHSVRKEERALLLQYCKAVPLLVAGLLGKEKSIVASGGVLLEEIDFKTMASRKVPRLYIVGDLLNINRPSGGYSLQLCWSMGYVAGLHAAEGA